MIRSRDKAADELAIIQLSRHKQKKSRKTLAGAHRTIMSRFLIQVFTAQIRICSLLIDITLNAQQTDVCDRCQLLLVAPRS